MTNPASSDGKSGPTGGALERVQSALGDVEGYATNNGLSPELDNALDKLNGAVNGFLQTTNIDWNVAFQGVTVDYPPA